jgi:phage tail protein X
VATSSSYTTIQGDTWDGIAFVVCGDEMQMHWLIEANPQHREIVIFPAGVVLEIPDLGETTTSSPAPPWVSNG